jgi:ribokinase
MDLVCRTPHLPAPGETIEGTDLLQIPGGKGANQAVAAARLASPDTPVHLIGRVGDDDFGQRLLTNLRGHRVDTKYVTITEATSTGCAMILVDRRGENSIILSPGANHRLTPADIDAAEALIATAAAVLIQLEVPLETVHHALAVCQRRGVFTILDPAPVPPKGLPRSLLGVDVLVPNQSEAESMLPTPRMGRMHRPKRVDAKQIAADLLMRGPKNVVVKLGPKGALVHERSGRIEHVKGHKVKVVDTTAAGDAFAGALAVALSEGRSLSEATRFANAAGACACRTFGAQPSLPSRADVDRLLLAP